ncbi:unnamed protein product [Darwinula stevensoni]|uniref:non-specific serine/threonine protein kinase n=1 Tax=Darwinula stevensoni TaxID=69355 RepID=A0A7R9A9H1_9CRUS|nr:unnamed protein product [Darwinula stevensoni]CAG0897354.1 unnamed protein product [Darwinula stevensoni]
MHGGVSRSTEVRHLKDSVKHELAVLLDQGDQWKLFMELIPKNLSDAESPPKYTHKDISIIEQGASQEKQLGFELLVEEWGTSGQSRPTVEHLLDLLVRGEMFAPADYLAIDVLNEEAPDRPVKGPAAKIPTNATTHFSDSPQMFITEHDSEVPLGCLSDIAGFTHVLAEAGNPVLGNVIPADLEVESHLSQIPYSVLSQVTNGFQESPLENGGRKIGQGAFGSVFLGIFGDGKNVAVKKLLPPISSKVLDQFKMEIQVLSMYMHENVLPPLGYSCDGPALCLLYDYMPCGNLLDRLASNGEDMILSWKDRVRIGMGTAAGIAFLHTNGEKPLIHRDVKSANILLDWNLIPKLADCSLARLGPSGQTESVAMTTTIMGTPVYMAHEAFRGQITAAMDTFSYGIVLFELISGLPPYDVKPDGDSQRMDLREYMESRCDEGRVLNASVADTRAGSVSDHLVISLLQLAFECIKFKANQRPSMTDVHQRLLDLSSIT